MSCFLNASLQLVWALMLSSDKQALSRFIGMPLDKGPKLLRPLVNSLQRLFRCAAQPTALDAVPVLPSSEVRRELFKLHYGQDVFDLNLKADAFEAYDFLLTCIHSWIRGSEEHCN